MVYQHQLDKCHVILRCCSDDELPRFIFPIVCVGEAQHTMRKQKEALHTGFFLFSTESSNFKDASLSKFDCTVCSRVQSRFII